MLPKREKHKEKIRMQQERNLDNSLYDINEEKPKTRMYRNDSLYNYMQRPEVRCQDPRELFAQFNAILSDQEKLKTKLTQEDSDSDFEPSAAMSYFDQIQEEDGLSLPSPALDYADQGSSLKRRKKSSRPSRPKPRPNIESSVDVLPADSSLTLPKPNK